MAFLRPTLERLISTDTREVAVFILTVRAFIEDWMDGQTVSKLHLDWFPRFKAPDLVQQYSLMFAEEAFAKTAARTLPRSTVMSGTMP